MLDDTAQAARCLGFECTWLGIIMGDWHRGWFVVHNQCLSGSASILSMAWEHLHYNNLRINRRNDVLQHRQTTKGRPCWMM